MHSYFRFIFLIFALALPLGAAQAQQSPKDFVGSIYKHYVGQDDLGLTWGEDPADAQRYFSQSLAKLIVDEEKTHPGELSDVIQVDFFVGGQDWLITKLTTDIVPQDATHCTAVVKFRNFGKPVQVTLALVNEAAGWRIDNITWNPKQPSLRALYEQWAAGQKKS